MKEEWRNSGPIFKRGVPLASNDRENVMKEAIDVQMVLPSCNWIPVIGHPPDRTPITR